MSIVSSNEVTIVVEAPAPPPTPVSCTLSVDKTRGKVGDTFVFTTYTTGLEGSYYIYIVDRAGRIYAGGLVYLSKSGTTNTFTWTPTAPGTYYLHAEVWYTV